MRDLFILVTTIGALPFAFARPFFGLLVFTYLGYLRPQDMSWGLAAQAHLSLLVAIATLAGTLCSKRERVVAGARPIFVMALLWSVIGITCVTALRPDLAFGFSRPAGPADTIEAHGFVDVTKVMLMGILATGLVYTEIRLRWLLLTMVLCLGLHATKSSIWAALHSGVLKHGPGGLITDNNDFALALVMMAPIAYYLMRTEKGRMRLVLMGLVPMYLACIVFTHSRGGFVALFVIVLLWTTKFRRKALALVVIPILLGLVVWLLPKDFIDRIETIKNFKKDLSAKERFVAWQKAFNMFRDRPLQGVGPNNFFAAYKYYPPDEGLAPRVVHNSYLQMLADSGLLALLLYLWMLLSTIALARRVRRFGEGNRFLLNTSHAVELSVIGFMIGSFFLSRTHFDMIYNTIGVTVALYHIARTGARERAVGGAPVEVHEPAEAAHSPVLQ